MRRLFNALIALGLAFLRNKPPGYLEEMVEADRAFRLEASVADVKSLIGWPNSNNNQALYEALDALQALRVKWDALAPDGQALWHDRAPLLAVWGWSDDRQRIRWAWLPEMAAMLFDPANSFTLLDIALTWQFASKYTLALFENVYRFHAIRATPWRAPNDWKLLIGGSDRYPEFREFKRTALLPALKELRENPNCPIDLELDEKRGVNNRIESLRFKITPRKQTSLGLNLPISDNPVLVSHLKRLGVKDDKARQLVRDYDENYLLAQVALTDRQKNKPTNVAGFFVKAVEDRYQDEVARHEEATQVRLEVARKQEKRSHLEANWRAFRRDEALGWWQARDTEVQQTLVRQFVEHHASETARRSYRKGGFDNRIFKLGFLTWLAEQPHVLHSAEALDLVDYTAFASQRT